MSFVQQRANEEKVCKTKLCHCPTVYWLTSVYNFLSVKNLMWIILSKQWPGVGLYLKVKQEDEFKSSGTKNNTAALGSYCEPNANIARLTRSQRDGGYNGYRVHCLKAKVLTGKSSTQQARPDSCPKDQRGSRSLTFQWSLELETVVCHPLSYHSFTFDMTECKYSVCKHRKWAKDVWKSFFGPLDPEESSDLDPATSFVETSSGSLA